MLIYINWPKNHNYFFTLAQLNCKENSYASQTSHLAVLTQSLLVF